MWDLVDNSPTRKEKTFAELTTAMKKKDFGGLSVQEQRRFYKLENRSKIRAKNFIKGSA